MRLILLPLYLLLVAPLFGQQTSNSFYSPFAATLETIPVQEKAVDLQSGKLTTEDDLRQQLETSGKTLKPIKEVMTPEELGNFKRYLAENIRYPQVAVEEGFMGTVIFLVKMDENNQIIQLAFTQRGQPAIDEEALRVILAMKPRIMHKQAEAGAYFYEVEVKFKLQ